MNSFEAKQQARIDRYKKLATKNQDYANDLFSKAGEMADCIPLGQPILVGHHSEKRDRRFRARINSTMQKGAEMTRKASHYKQKAGAAENNTAVSSDDPEAFQKLKTKLDELTTEKEACLALNKKFFQAGENIQLMKVPLETKQRLIADKHHSDEVIWKPVPSWKLSNLGSEIRRIKKRMKDLEEARQLPDAPPQEKNGVRLIQSKEDNRVQIFFPGKPCEKIVRSLKRHGFHWTPSNGCWQRQLNNTGTFWAQNLFDRFIMVNGELTLAD